MSDMRLFMVEALSELFDASAICLLGRDETNENLIELAAWPAKQHNFSIGLDEAERNGSALYWAFQQVQPLSIKYTNLPILRRLKQEFFPVLNFDGFVVVPAIYKANQYPDLVFFVIGNDLSVTQETLAIAQSFANHCAVFTRMSFGIEMIGAREKQLSNSLKTLNSTIQKHDELKEKELANTLLGNSANIVKVRNDIKKLGSLHSSVLILGDTGTGKELVAHALHNFSDHRLEPFVAVNMAEINANLIESAFFGHVKGAFTGADKNKEGFLSQAKGGTLFLDEIGDLPLDLQAKLLRVLQEKKYRQVGSSEESIFAARIICATHKDLGSMVEENLFRRDLYYRLAESRILIAPLSERISDIAILVQHFIDAYNQSHNTDYFLSDESLAAFRELSFPGNVRQLRSLIQNICHSANDNIVITPHLIKEIYDDNRIDCFPSRNLEKVDLNNGFQKACEAYEEKILNQFLKNFSGSKHDMAKTLQISERTLFYKLKKYDLEVLKK
ncbi:sigma-54 dependent transcriptional regulator [Bartonella sp. HY329]|uniref:sigma 54-interacting transcriptional regulator n=1 Tax=unclassified Bartonella TaxID=2645622 RepID=UPI0021C78C02|nr:MULTISPECIES: sigma-54 dependent transcriptional regulator [unclassified Bartonella]UXM95229.1 sigma-54 dependent transcriptional regulator [Bartonella sp. HY329]UXN09553.1 sigma-54 dependent transcriptional regulator [Bartonella sp. HY328]